MSNKSPVEIQVLGKHIGQEQLKYHHKTVLVCKEFTFDSAHHLHCYEGNCQNLHGHTYKLQVVMQGKMDYRGMVIDFSEMKSIVKERIVDRLDHQYLNAILPPMNTTAENMVVWMYEQIDSALKDKALSPAISLAEVRLWETPTSYAAVTAEMMNE